MCNCQLKYANKPKLICCSAAQSAKQVQLKRVLDVEIPCKTPTCPYLPFQWLSSLFACTR